MNRDRSQVKDRGQTDTPSPLHLFFQLRKEFERLGRKQIEVNVENLIKSKVSSYLPSPLCSAS